MTKNYLLIGLMLCLSWHQTQAQPSQETQKGRADATCAFSYFTYQGKDQRFAAPYDHNRQYLNPVRSGYYPDPSVCRIGKTFYMVNSSFGSYPGVPIATSQDLVSWQPAGYVLDRPSQLPLANQPIAHGGIYAPTIRYNKRNKTFYMITTNVGRGNFLVKSKDPSNGWSDPIWLPKVQGIDPDLLFDDDGKAYIVHNASVTGKPAYEGQTAIRLFEFDVKGDSTRGHFTEIVRGGTHVEEKPIWIEGPHLYKHGHYYYLMCAEGGTGEHHSEVIFRAKKPQGPWEEYSGNPILTQRDLSDNRGDPVSCTGHADLVEDGTGQWWAVFLGCRPYEGNFYNTGRETFLLPVTWKNDWPVILEHGKAIPTLNAKRGIQLKVRTSQTPEQLGITGNVSYTDRFDSTALNHRWSFVRNPSAFWATGSKGLVINGQPTGLTVKENPLATFVHQQNASFTAETELTQQTQKANTVSGMLLLQGGNANIVFGTMLRQGKPVIVLRRTEKTPVIVASAPIEQGAVKLKVFGDGRWYSFYYQQDSQPWRVLASGVDASNLSTTKAGGFIGTLIGLGMCTINE